MILHILMCMVRLCIYLTNCLPGCVLICLYSADIFIHSPLSLSLSLSLSFSPSLPLSNGWKVILLTLDIGCRGYINNNVYVYLSSWVCLGWSVVLLLRAVSQVALRCSYVIYLNRNKAVWHIVPYVSRLEGLIIGSL